MYIGYYYQFLNPNGTVLSIFFSVDISSTFLSLPANSIGFGTDAICKINI